MKGIKMKRNNVLSLKKVFLFIFVYISTVSLSHATDIHIECTSAGANLSCLHGDYRGEWLWKNGYSFRVSGEATIEIKRNGVSLGHYGARPKYVSFGDNRDGKNLEFIRMTLDVDINGVTHKLDAIKEYFPWNNTRRERYTVLFDGQRHDYYI